MPISVTTGEILLLENLARREREDGKGHRERL